MQVRAKDASLATSAYSATASARTLSTLTAPTGLVVVPGAGMAELSWNAVSGASDYDLCYGASATACNGTIVLSGGKTAERLSGLPLDTRYFAVRARAGTCVSAATADADARLFALTTLFQKDGIAVSNDNFGYNVSAGDVDGDGRADFLVGAPRTASTSPGTATLFSGSTGSVLFPVAGTVNGQYLGYAVSILGDTSGDGRPDFLVGAPRSLSDKGSVFLYSGADGGERYHFDGLATTYAIGYAVAGLGDLDGDGQADFAVSSAAPAADRYAGRVFIYSGATGALIREIPSPADAEYFGTALAAVGDLNGDGKMELLVGAGQQTGADAGAVVGPGRAYVYSGADGSLLYAKSGVAVGDVFGQAVAAAGDINGDGVPDFVVGARYADPYGRVDAGSVYVYSGADGSQLASYHGETAGDMFGSSLASAGDLNGDGIADLVVGAYGGGGATRPGAIYVLSGKDGSVLYKRVGEGAGASLGFSAAAADVSGDGNLDLLVGSHALNAGVGRAYVMATSEQLGVTPSESHNSVGPQGAGTTQMPSVAANASRQFTASGGTGPYTFAVLLTRGAVIDSNGLFTAGFTPGVYETVRIKDAKGRSHDTRIAVTGAALGTLPRRPTSLRAKTASATQVNLTWVDNSNNETGFVVERRTPAGAWTQIATPAAGVTTYSATGLTLNTKYFFRVKATNGAGDSLWSPVASATTDACASTCGGGQVCLAGKCLMPGTWTATDTAGAPPAAYDNNGDVWPIWTGSRVIFWGGQVSGGGPSSSTATGGLYDPATNTWTSMNTSGAPAGAYSHVSAWTGKELLVWGGIGAGSSYLATGGRYNPSTDTWTAMETASAPTARQAPFGVWTGTRLLVWGGRTSGGVVNTGAAYDPVTNTWEAMPTAGAPTAREIGAVVWTGQHMIVWGGGLTPTEYTSGGRYDPVAKTWAPMSTSGAPGGHLNSRAVWTGSRMVVWAGGGAGSTEGGIYDPVTDTWALTASGSPSKRNQNAMVWTGQRVLVWGGADATFFSDGALLNPVANAWEAMPNTGAPAGRAYVGLGVWTGSQFFVWGGTSGGSTALNTGGLYTPPVVADETTAPTTGTVRDGTGADLTYQSSATTMNANWSGFSDASGVVSYDYNISTSAACTGDVVATSNVGSTTAVVTSGLTLTAGSYYNCVRAIDAYGNTTGWVASSGVTVDLTAPTAPGSVTLTAAGSGTVGLSWTSSTDATSGVSTYEVGYCNPAPCTPPTTAQVTGLTLTSTSVPSLTGCNTYRFGVRARDGAGNVGAYATVDASPNATTWQCLRTVPSMIYFGGNDPTVGVKADVWALLLPPGGTPTWMQLSPAGTGPTGRGRVRADYDSTRDRFLVYGGHDAASAPSSEVWALTLGATPTWSKLTTSGSAPVKEDAATVYQTSSDRLVVTMGDTGATGLNTTEALTLSGSPAWTTLTPSGTVPGAQSVASLSPGYAYDATAERLFVNLASGATHLLSLTGATPAWSTLAPTGAPAGVSDQALIWDPVGSRIVRFGGNTSGASGSVLDETWSMSDPALGTAAWAQFTSTLRPPARQGATALYDAANRRMLIHGGVSAGSVAVASDLWALDLSSPTSIRGWSKVTAYGTGPSSRIFAAAAYVPAPACAVACTGGQVCRGGQCVTPDSWTATSTTNAPEARAVDDTPGYLTVWTGTKLLAWGGKLNDGNLTNTGGVYDPATGLWSTMSTTGAPAARMAHSMVWTGTKLLVWGGYNSTSRFPDGGRYDPATDSWEPITTVNAPTARAAHGAVWTGSRMLVWGGYTQTPTPLNTGGSYDPISNTWAAISTTNAPSARQPAVALWTGAEMLIWGGGAYPSCSPITTGARYNPTNDTWTPMSATSAPAGYPASRAVWTGSRMVVFGGAGCGGSHPSGEGGIYDPAADTWVLTTTVGAPSGRQHAAMAWTGTRALVWSGANDFGTRATDGFLFDPIANTWSPSTNTNAPAGRLYMGSGAWTGNQLIVWGGSIGGATPYTNTGGVYTPALAGQLDASFGNAGLVTTDFTTAGEYANAVLVQPDSRIVVCGVSNVGGDTSWAFSRYLPSGILDPSFGTAGKATFALSAGDDRCNALARDSNGKLVAVGSANGDFGVLRLNDDGSLDTTFGSGTGKLTTDFGGNESATALVLQSNGKIVAVGGANGSKIVLARYNTDGTLDTTGFGTSGKVATQFTSQDNAAAVALQADGKIVVAGAGNTGSNWIWSLVRYNTDGSTDTTFGTAGRVSSFASISMASAVTVLSDGKLVAGGYMTGSNGYDFAVARYLSDGTPDSTFGTAGKTTTSLSTGHDSGYGMAVQADGRIVLAGSAAASAQLGIVRYTASGILDPSFGTSGITTAGFGSDSGWAQALAIQPDGKLVMAGTRDLGNSSQRGFFVGRFWQ